jgi:hypothetical protein
MLRFPSRASMLILLNGPNHHLDWLDHRGLRVKFSISYNKIGRDRLQVRQWIWIWSKVVTSLKWNRVRRYSRGLMNLKEQPRCWGSSRIGRVLSTKEMSLFRKGIKKKHSGWLVLTLKEPYQSRFGMTLLEEAMMVLSLELQLLTHTKASTQSIINTHKETSFQVEESRQETMIRVSPQICKDHSTLRIDFHIKLIRLVDSVFTPSQKYRKKISLEILGLLGQVLYCRKNYLKVDH